VTSQDFILSILTSILATVFYKYSEKALLYVRSQAFRNVRVWVKSEARAFKHPVKFVHVLMPMLIITLVLALAPTSLAPDKSAQEFTMAPTDQTFVTWGAQSLQPGSVDPRLFTYLIYRKIEK